MPVSLKTGSVVALILATASPALAAPTPQAAMTAFERGPTTAQAKGGDALGVGTIAERMKRAKVPGVSVAVVDACKIVWARGYGVRAANDTAPVGPDTRFQAASISKTLTAVAALRLAQQGKLDIDKPVNAQLRDWKLPGAPGIDLQKVTPRALMSHTGGTTIDGFPGYARGTLVPTLGQVLAGGPPANTGPVIADRAANAQMAYSGGGVSVVQKLIEDVSGASFAQVQDREVIGPAGMTRSSFTLPASDIALGHGDNGAPIAGGWHTYPELAAAGLWTTSGDLAQFGIAVSRAYEGRGDLLPQDLAREALKPQSAFKRPFGLGFRTATTEGDDPIFFHAGGNEGYRAIFAFDAKHCQGLAIMTNGNGGGDLMMSLMRDIGRLYDWPFIKILVD
jgi:CubicO group peptidase (beta-lactamase class C family)